MYRVLIAAGGTGGHLRPALSCAEAIVRAEPAASIHFATAGRPLDERFLGGRGFGLTPLFPSLTRAPKRTELGAYAKAFSIARALLRDFEPDVVVGCGGYVTLAAGLATLGSAPVAFARAAFGLRGRTPLVLLEQNALPGGAVRVLARSASAVLLTFDAAAAHCRGARTVLTGNPLAPEFASEPAAATCDPAQFGLAPGRPTLVVLGGSQGARGVNEMVLGARRTLAERRPDLQILHVAGDADFENVRAAVSSAPEPRTVVVPFETRMRAAYEIADVVVARAGGTTLAEVAAVGRPAILVPYPHHKDGHQFANAAVFERAGAARVVAEAEGAAERLAAEVTRYLEDKTVHAEAVRAARALGPRDAADRAASEILTIAKQARATSPLGGRR